MLARLKDYGIKINPAKCKFFQDSVVFCAHRIDKEGIHKTEDKIEAVIKAPRPQDISELRSWVALVNYYHRFLPNLSTVLYPLHQLLHIDKKWHWSSECDQAFEKTKKMIASDLVLAHYEENLPLKLHCDASSRGLGAVISHMYLDGSERPLSFASRSLSKAEKNCTQIDREALSIVWAIKKVPHVFICSTIYSRDRLQIVTLDIQPSERYSKYCIISFTKMGNISQWLQLHNRIPKKTSEHGNADGLSRLPLPDTGKSFEKVCDLGYVTLLDNFPVTFKQIAKETVKQKFLGKFIEFTKDGWPSKVEQELLNPLARRNEISVVQHCLIWNNRVIIPECFQETMLKELHSAHPGVVKIKSLTRSYI